jgi:ribonucleoside-diphosphate reductase alpha subunit
MSSISENTKIFSEEKFIEHIKNIIIHAENIHKIKFEYVDSDKLCTDIIDKMGAVMTWDEIMDLSMETAYSYVVYEPQYEYVASAIAWYTHHQNTPHDPIKVLELLYNNVNPLNGKSDSRILKDVLDFALENEERIRSVFNYDNDYKLSYFSYRTLCRSYFQKINKKNIESMQDLFLRVALGIHYKTRDIEAMIKTYFSMSNKFYTHATPTLFNAGTPKSQNSSCYLLHVDDDLDDIYEVLKRCAKISKQAGGIGLNVSAIRVGGTPIKGTGGKSNGIVPMIKVYNETARYVDQCFDPTTIVYTQTGPIQMCNLKQGDYVLTNEGKYSEIDKILKHRYTGDVLKIKINNISEEIILTSEHQIFTLQNVEEYKDYNYIIDRLNNGLKPTLVDAEELCINNFVCYPIPVNLELNELKLNDDDCKFYGLLLKYGSIMDTYSVSQQLNKNVFKLTYVNIITDDHIDFIKQYLLDRNVYFNFVNCVKEQNKKDKHYKLKSLHSDIDEKYDSDDENMLPITNKHYKFSFTTDNLKIKYDDFYIGEHIIMPTQFINLPLDKMVVFLKQFISDPLEANNKTISMILNSYDISQYVRFLLLKLGIMSGYREHIIRSEYCNIESLMQFEIFFDVTQHVANIFDIKPIAADDIFPIFTNYFVHNNMIYCKIDNIEKAKYKGYLYDLEVNDTHTYVTLMGACHNGGGKRKGSFAFYLEPWHAEVVEFMELKLQHGEENLRARDIFTALWVPDLFMKRVEQDGIWSLFCPSKIKDKYGIGFQDLYGDEFEKLYEQAERDKMYNSQMRAQVLYYKICEIQTSTSLPYMMYKDHVNRKSNQKNIDICRGSNLCTEITEVTNKEFDSVCNLASLALPEYVFKKNNIVYFDFELLGGKVEELVHNLNSIIDVNEYPTDQSKVANLSHRPIGIGVQGLADVFAKFKYMWGSAESRKLNKDIFETIYYYAVKKSHELAMIYGSYDRFEGSPTSLGILQFDMWNVVPSDKYDWNALKENVKKGIRNSLLIAPMPTASTAQILGNNESIEMYNEMIYSRKVLSGEFYVVNKYLVEDLRELDLWNKAMVNEIITNEGSIQNINNIPQNIKDTYKTVWETSQKIILEMSADRCAFVDQSQSTNIHIASPTIRQVSTMHMDGWKLGLKTGMYYLRTRSASKNIKFTIIDKIDCLKETYSDKFESKEDGLRKKILFQEKNETINGLKRHENRLEGRITLSRNKSIDELLDAIPNDYRAQEIKPLTLLEQKSMQKNKKQFICEEDVCIACSS